jgi:hypothetical protein
MEMGWPFFPFCIGLLVVNPETLLADDEKQNFPDSGVLTYLTASISDIFGNNPDFVILTAIFFV